ncbi:hypothetical protein PVAND_015563 [Polypedilum vanderplanki]|uniref:Lipoprotein n=1 Tax=Polypedilum vanderplanki TaxID=319348 RepID=A0A9J6BDI8_POLVA|nr:hypothetical protein PVAND_015563 [Polypedilum vanderplanki]
MKYLWFNSFLILFATCLVIICNFEKSSIINVYYASNLYICNINKDPSITSPNIIIKKVIGTHISMSHKNVEGFYSDSISFKIHYIPHGVHNFFPKFVLIYINNGRVKEIHQNDLVNYPKLKYLDLDENDSSN